MNVSSDIWHKVFERDNGICRYCGKDLLAHPSDFNSATCDHICPRSEGGDDSIQNLALACMSCNTTLSRCKKKTFKGRVAYLRPKLKKQEQYWKDKRYLLRKKKK